MAKKKVLCIWHGGCDDGFAAAWAVRAALGDGVEFHPGVYQTPPPDVAGRDVVLVDFSYKRPVLDEMARQADSILILDHHKTAAEDLAGLQAPFGPGWDRHLGNVRQDIYEGCSGRPYALFDMHRSGATMAWDFFCGGARPSFLLYIEDRDLWRKALPDGDLFTMAVRSYPQDFGVWDDLIKRRPEELIAEGNAIHRFYRLRVEEMKRHAYPAIIDDVRCYIANAPYFAASELAGELGEQDRPFGACYFEVEPGRYQYSLRSRGDFDVSAIAGAFGGGGHRNAAGFTWTGHAHQKG